MKVDTPSTVLATLGGVLVGAHLPVAVMGALNVSPESFHAGSVHAALDDLCRAASAMVGAGASLVDVGAMSTAPYLAAAIDEDEEARRLGAAVAALAGTVGVTISADTARSRPAQAALDAGATVLNDVSGLAHPAVAKLAAERGASVVLVASPAAAAAGTVRIDPSDPVGTVRACLDGALRRAIDAGIDADRIVLDPGIGFFLDTPDERARWDVTVLAALEQFAGLGRPVAVGVSRKSFLGALTGRRSPAERLPASLAATALAVAAGAALVRAHDVAETVDAVRVATGIVEAGRS